jgi:hypothetical protein
MTAENDLIARLDEILTIERKALLSGDLARLESIVQEKEQLVGELNTLEMAKTAASDDVNAKLKHNQALLEGAMQGIRNIAEKLAEIRRIRREFDTYTEQGEKNRLKGDVESSFEKRA